MSSESQLIMDVKPIGSMQSVFRYKNGTPRQATICTSAKGSLTLDKAVFNNPEHSLDGLEEFSHVWIIFLFHQNNNECSKAKVKPPRLNGIKKGLFATRCPYRPCPLGLTLARIEKIEGATVYFTGIDIIDGTPILDIKPYIPEYDCPHSDVTVNADCSRTDCLKDEISATDSLVHEPSVANWLKKPEVGELTVEFTPRALRQLSEFSTHASHDDFRLIQLKDHSEVRRAISDILSGDPRSAYRRQCCQDKLYYFTVDVIHVTCWFDDNLAEVLKIQPINQSTLVTHTTKKSNEEDSHTDIEKCAQK